MDERVCVATDFKYRDEFVHTLASGQVVIFPSWLGGQKRCEFVSKNEAMNFVDARRAYDRMLLAESFDLPQDRLFNAEVMA